MLTEAALYLGAALLRGVGFGLGFFGVLFILMGGLQAAQVVTQWWKGRHG